MSRTLPRPILGNGNSLERRAVIGKLSNRNRDSRDSLFRQRNELMLLWNRGKTSGFPVLLGLLDPFLAGGDEIPPDVPRTLQRVAAEEHHPRRPKRCYRDAVARPEDQQLWA